MKLGNEDPIRLHKRRTGMRQRRPGRGAKITEVLMKRLKGIGLGRLRDDGHFECDKIVLELDHGRTITICRESEHGEDGITLHAGIERENQTANGRFVVRVPNFGQIHLSIEQAK